jgi:hypothetical protein
MDDDYNGNNIKMLINFNSKLNLFQLGNIALHVVYNLDSFRKIDSTWWWPYTAETCSEG